MYVYSGGIEWPNQERHGWKCQDCSQVTDINQQFRKANSLHQKGQLLEAERLYTNILKSAPRLVPVLNMCGILKAQQGEYLAALDRFNAAISVEPHNVVTNENLARVCMGLQHFVQAQACYERLLKINPRSYNALFGLGCALMPQKNHTAALQAFTQAEVLNRKDPNLYLNLGTVLRRMGRMDEAVRNLNKVFDLEPGSVDAHACLGLLYMEANDYPAAVEHYSRAIEQGGQRLDLELGLAEALEKRGDEAQARQHYFKAVELDPLSQNAYTKLDKFLLHSGDTEKKQFLQKLASDHVYADWGEALNDARELAGMYDYPDKSILAALHCFLTDYTPGELHDRTWWQAQLDAFGDPRNGHDKVLRGIHSNIFSWSLPDRETLARISDFVGDGWLYSYGAGAGYWERLLREHFNLDVVASDFKLRHRFMPMSLEDYSTAVVPTDATIILSWIIRGDFGVMNVLDQIQTTQQLVLIGEPPDSDGIPRICATPDVFAKIDAEFTLVQSIPLVSYSHMNDTVSLYVKH